MNQSTIGVDIDIHRTVIHTQNSCLQTIYSFFLKPIRSFVMSKQNVTTSILKGDKGEQRKDEFRTKQNDGLQTKRSATTAADLFVFPFNG